MKVIQGDPFTKNVGPCCICDGKAEAVWHASPNIVICLRCALDVLPRLIADTIGSHHYDHLNSSCFKRYEHEIISTFRFAAICSLSGKLEDVAGKKPTLTGSRPNLFLDGPKRNIK